MVQSSIQYGIIAWVDCNTTLYLAVSQKNLIKIILGKPKTYPSVELFKLLLVVDISNLYKKQAICYIFRTNAIKSKIQTYNKRKTFF